MSGVGGRSGPAAGVLNGLIICAGFYSLLGVVVLVGGPSALLLFVLVALGLLHGCLSCAARTAGTTTRSPVAVA